MAQKIYSEIDKRIDKIKINLIQIKTINTSQTLHNNIKTTHMQYPTITSFMANDVISNSPPLQYS